MIFDEVQDRYPRYKFSRLPRAHTGRFCRGTGRMMDGWMDEVDCVYGIWSFVYGFMDLWIEVCGFVVL